MTLVVPRPVVADTDAAAVAPAVDALGVVRRYRGGRGVGPVDLCVAAGEVMGLMGPNGAGKTTLLRILASIDRPQRGTVWWEGGGGVREARRSIGLALDSAVEEATLSGLQSAHFWCRQWVADGAAALALCESALRSFGLWEVRDEPAGAYSYGMRRRLALVEALAHAPRLALLDEPTAGLDPSGVEALATELARRSAAGHTTIVASNDPNFVAAACDRVAFLCRGLVVRCASPAELQGSVPAVRIAELTTAGAPPVDILRDLPGVDRVDAHADGAAVSFQDPAALARIVTAADAPGGRLQQLHLHEPNLVDAFRALTGEDLAQESAV